MSAPDTETFTIRIPCPTIYPERKQWNRDTPPDQPLVTYNVPCEGSLRPCPVCHAVRYCGREGQCLDGQTAQHVVRQHFLIEDIDYGIPGGVPGWTRGEHWNGWACPRFEKTEALAILAMQEEMGGRGEYDEATDTMHVWTTDDEDDGPEAYPGCDLETPDGTKRVYAVGAWGWIWDAREER